MIEQQSFDLSSLGINLNEMVVASEGPALVITIAVTKSVSTHKPIPRDIPQVDLVFTAPREEADQIRSKSDSILPELVAEEIDVQSGQSIQTVQPGFIPSFFTDYSDLSKAYEIYKQYQPQLQAAFIQIKSLQGGCVCPHPGLTSGSTLYESVSTGSSIGASTSSQGITTATNESHGDEDHCKKCQHGHIKEGKCQNCGASA